MPFKRPFSALAVLLGCSVPFADAESDVTGLWLTERGKVAVELFSCGQELCGRIAWLADPTAPGGGPRLDTENPDPALRDRRWCGMTVITGLKPAGAGAGAWQGGRFYYPKHGRDYALKLERQGDRLRVRAYAGIEIIGKTEHWTRADPGLAGCPRA